MCEERVIRVEIVIRVVIKGEKSKDGRGRR